MYKYSITDINGKIFNPAVDDNGHIDISIQDVKIHPSKSVILKTCYFHVTSQNCMYDILQNTQVQGIGTILL